MCVYLHVIPQSREQNFKAKSSLYTGYREAGKVLFKAGSTCRFKIRVEWVCKDNVKAFPVGCTGVKQVKKTQLVS